MRTNDIHILSLQIIGSVLLYSLAFSQNYTICCVEVMFWLAMAPIRGKMNIQEIEKYLEYSLTFKILGAEISYENTI